MESKLLQEVVEKIIGKPGSVIVELLQDKRDVNEFKIADKLKLTINQIRNLLYKLYEQNIVSFTRKKDKSKGWYIYYWTLDHLKALELLYRMKQKELQQGQGLLKSRENKRFYRCPDGDVEMNEENALNHDFLCPECGQLLEIHNEKEKLTETAKNMEGSRKEMMEIHTHIVRIREELSKKAEKVREKDKAKKKKSRADARASAKKKEARESSKAKKKVQKVRKIQKIHKKPKKR